MPQAPPTEPELNFARNIASVLGLQLGNAEGDRKVCRDFISTHKAAFKARLAQAQGAGAPAQTKSAVAGPRLATDSQKSKADEFRAELQNEESYPELESDYERAIQTSRACTEFISMAKARLDESRYLRDLDRIALVPAFLKALEAAPNLNARIELVKHYKAAGRRQTGNPTTPHEALAAYWAEAIRRTEFAGLATADNLLGGKKDASFTLDEACQALAADLQPQLDLKADPAPVRHLVVRLPKRGGGSGRPEFRVVCVLPLQASSDDSSRGYRWGAARSELPRFNRELLGEEATVDGLSLLDDASLDAYLEDRAEALAPPVSPEESAPPLDQAWKTLDTCFERLTSGATKPLDLRGWIHSLRRARLKDGVTFTLVDGKSVTGPSVHVANTLAVLLEDRKTFGGPALTLLRNVASFVHLPPVAFDHGVEACRLEHLQSYSGHMDSRKKDRREGYPLDPAQRDALLALQPLGAGQLLTVNGPPGTGKTSLLRAVIATAWVTPLLVGAEGLPEPPLILASAATNQAVTNIISSFDETPGPALFDDLGAFIGGAKVARESRWLPWLSSYGWFAPAGEAEERYDRYQQVRRRRASDPWRFHGASLRLNDLTPDDAQRLYLRCASAYLGSGQSLVEVLDRLQGEVLDEWEAVGAIRTHADDWLNALAALYEVRPWDAQQEARRSELEARNQALTTGITQLGRDIEQLDGVLVQLQLVVRYVQNPKKALDELKLAQTMPGHPMVMEMKLLSSADKHLQDQQETLQRRLSGNFLHKLLEHGRSLLKKQEVEADQEALVRVLTQAGVVLVSGAEIDLTAMHTAIGTRREQIASQLQILAVKLLGQHLLGTIATQPGQLIEALQSRLAAIQEGRVQHAALRETKRSEGTQLLHELSALNARMSMYAKRRQAAVMGLDVLRGSLQRPGAPADLSAKVNLLLQKALGAPGEEPRLSLEDHRRTLIKLLQDRLDLHERLKLFHLAARYWEGRYVQEALRQQQHSRDDATYQPSSTDALRHLSMLAPVFVATAASTPKLMRRNPRTLSHDDSPYLFGHADLLIVDEAGQASAEGSATSFAFAKRALVVGDVDQLVPVWSIDAASDALMAKQLDLQRFVAGAGGDPRARLTASGLMASSGSIMRAAQNATGSSKPNADQPGLTLTNHYRCLEPIIAICNRMVYKGELNCVTRVPNRLWQPHLSRLAYLTVPDNDNTKLPSGSRANDAEAALIARWLRENQRSLLDHFAPAGDKNLADIVGIVTPYKPQTFRLRKEIALALDEPEGDLPDGQQETRQHKRMTIGTVHSLQGAEKEVVIFAMVDTFSPTEPQFYDNRHDMINVAVSRAKHMFIATLSRAAERHGLGLSDKAMAEGRGRKPSDYLMQAMMHHGSRLNPQKLVVVESPNKRKLVHQALGGRLDTEVLASGGHIRELLPHDQWDASTADAPAWGELKQDGLRLLDAVAFYWPGLYELYLATDADAEGEAIAWHCLDVLKSRLSSLGVPDGPTAQRPRVRRMRFNTLRPDDILAAMTDAADGLDDGMVKSALARNFLDHLVSGHLPVRLGLAENPGLQAGVGRVQLGICDLVALYALTPVRHEVHLRMPLADGQTLTAPVLHDGKPVAFHSSQEAQSQAAELTQTALDAITGWRLSTRSWLDQVDSLPVVNTARFLALAYRAYGYSPQQSMALLQQLYEGGASIGRRTSEEIQDV